MTTAAAVDNDDVPGQCVSALWTWPIHRGAHCGGLQGRERIELQHTGTACAPSLQAYHWEFVLVITSANRHNSGHGSQGYDVWQSQWHSPHIARSPFDRARSHVGRADTERAQARRLRAAH